MKSYRAAHSLEQYAPLVRVNRRLAGPVFAGGLLCIVSYLVATFCLWCVGFAMTGFWQAAYLVGFGVFLVAVYLSFAAFLLRQMMKGRSGNNHDTN